MWHQEVVSNASTLPILDLGLPDEDGVGFVVDVCNLISEQVSAIDCSYLGKVDILGKVAR